MKAMVQDKYGSPDVLEFRAIDKPVVKDDDVLVRVRAAAVNIGDWHLLRGVHPKRVGCPKRPRGIRIVEPLRPAPRDGFRDLPV
jgi:NADPH:quinone reductase-like Zn-dependent oxidoreductase